MNVYNAIKEIAYGKKITIYQIEKDLKFTPSLISKWNTSMPSADRLQNVADYLGVTMQFILDKARKGG
ncbi:helix-turn-helix domain-containing protein [Bombilactobacillus folatiphilus]|uniref:Helix-turn-helix domain-containing protein n=1 Tax=Bombilactobacillus folatiphilus TaxID=2923362 RepID=A0ABY4PA50_9LACO|nr:helix-turn-helix transcriptional regulator [Bombilactobacillus folatiphilus]UQS82579.1 helix-turn-helix domain-containing protein [Bombilactobacillus folatiphilus]